MPELKRRRARFERPLALGVFALALVVGCASGPTFRDGEYRSERLAFRLGPLPAGLERLDSTEALLAFREDRAGASWAISARCGVDGDDVPLRALSGHLFLHFNDKKILAEREFVLDGRAALDVEALASVDGVRRQFVVVVLRKNECVYDFLHVSGPGEDGPLRQSRADFRAMVDGFRVLGGS